MKMHYYPETDSLYIELRSGDGVEVKKIAEGFNADFDIKGRVVSFDIDCASIILDLTTLDVVALPHKSMGTTRS